MKIPITEETDELWDPLCSHILSICANLDGGRYREGMWGIVGIEDSTRLPESHGRFPPPRWPRKRTITIELEEQ